MHIHNIITTIYTSSSRWTRIHRVSLQCLNEVECRLQFGMEAPTFTPLPNTLTIISRGISTVPLHLNFSTTSTTTATDVATTQSVTTTTTTTKSSTTTNLPSTVTTVTLSMSSREVNILKHIIETPRFNCIHGLVSVLGHCVHLYVYFS